MDVSFNEEKGYARSSPASRKGLSGFLIRSGYVKDERQASALLLGITVVCILGAVSIWSFSGSEPSVSPEEYQELGP